jgi:transcriptional regulator GlxA family with amidase domain
MQTRSRNVALLLFDEVELLDVAAPLSVLSQAGRHWNWRPFKIFTVAERAGAVSTRSQIAVVAEHELSACPAPEIVIVPGGYGARRALASAATLSWLAATKATATTIATLGNGLLLLAKSGLLAGAKVPARTELAAELSELEPSLTIEAVGASSSDTLLESGAIVAGSGSGGALELALRIVARTLGPKLANGTAQGLGIPWLAPESSVAVLSRGKDGE